MLVKSAGNITQERIADLEQEIQALRAKDAPAKTASTAREGRGHQRNGRVVLAPGFVATTIPGSLYSTILLTMAAAGKLDLHDHHFGRFGKSPTLASARKLLDAIGVYIEELEIAVRRNTAYREHCAHRTRMWRDRASKGGAKAKDVLRNPKIFKKGRWVGDIAEAINILLGAQNPSFYDRGKNVGILRKLKLITAITARNGMPVFYLFPAKYRALFHRARILAGE